MEIISDEKLEELQKSINRPIPVFLPGEWFHYETMNFYNDPEFVPTVFDFKILEDKEDHYIVEIHPYGSSQTSDSDEPEVFKDLLPKDFNLLEMFNTGIITYI